MLGLWPFPVGECILFWVFFHSRRIEAQLCGLTCERVYYRASSARVRVRIGCCGGVSSLAAIVGAVLLADSLLWPLAALAAIWVGCLSLLEGFLYAEGSFSLRGLCCLSLWGGLSPRVCHNYHPQIYDRAWCSYCPRIRDIAAARGQVWHDPWTSACMLALASLHI
jgi:hypothetical protein